MDILPQLILNSIIAGAIYTLVALGFNLIYNTTKFIDMSYGALVPVGAYGVFLFYKQLGLNLAVAIILALLFAAFVGWLLDRFIYRPLRKKKSSNLSLLIASLGAFTVVQALLAIFFSSQFQTLSKSNTGARTFDIAGGVITDVQLVMLVLGVLIFLGIYLVTKFTMFGKGVKAVSDDEEVAKIVGIDTNKIIGWVFAIAAVIAGLAGILVGFDTGLEPTMGLHLLLKGIIASIIGGIGNLYGGILGAFLLGFVENFGIWQISGEWKDAIAFGVLIVFLLLRPNGILKR